MRILLAVDGSAYTKTMIFAVAKLVSDVSQFMTLLPGDIITTGTPLGVGMGVKSSPRLPEKRRSDDPRHRRPGRATPTRRAVHRPQI